MANCFIVCYQKTVFKVSPEISCPIDTFFVRLKSWRWNKEEMVFRRVLQLMNKKQGLLNDDSPVLKNRKYLMNDVYVFSRTFRHYDLFYCLLEFNT